MARVIKIPVIDYNGAMDEKNPDSKVIGFEYAVSVNDKTYKITDFDKMHLEEEMYVEIEKIVSDDMVQVKRVLS